MTTLATTESPAPEPTPAPPPLAWFSRYAESFTSGEAHAFLLHGDVEGYTPDGMAVKEFLVQSLASTREVVAVYNLAEGIRLHQPDEPVVIGETGGTVTRKERALQLVGAAAAPAGPANPLAAALGTLAPPAADPFEAARRPAEALALLGRLLRAEGRVAVLVDYAETVCPVPTLGGAGAMSPDDRAVLVALQGWGKDPTIGRVGNPVFLVTRAAGDLHPALRAADSGWKAVEVALPDREARAAYFAGYLARKEAEGQPLDIDGLTVAEVATLTAGLNLRHLEDVILLAAQRGGLTPELLKSRKDEIIRLQFSDVAEMVEPLAGGLDALGAQETLKRFARERIVAPVRAGNTARVPKGVMLVGPPGTGKTFFVSALARDLGFNAVSLSMGRILGGIVGESEARMERFWSFARALAPVLVFIDEIDQSDISRRGNGSGNPVASNLFNTMLRVMSDETLRGKVIVICASNRPDLVDSALLRFGRMDAVIPVLLPEPADRRSILAAQAEAQGVALPALAYDAFVAATADWSAGDLTALVRKYGELAERLEGPEATRRALEYIRPNSPETAVWYTGLAVQAANDAEYLPEKYRAMLSDRPALEKQIEAAAPADTARRARAL